MIGMCKIRTNEVCPKCVDRNFKNVQNWILTGKYDSEIGNVSCLDREFWGGLDWFYTCNKCGYSEIRGEGENEKVKKVA